MGKTLYTPNVIMVSGKTKMAKMFNINSIISFKELLKEIYRSVNENESIEFSERFGEGYVKITKWDLRKKVVKQSIEIEYKRLDKKYIKVINIEFKNYS